MFDKKDDKSTATAKRAELSDEVKERAAERAEEAQEQAPEGVVCELCHHPIDKDAAWAINRGTGGYAHKDGNCPEGDEDTKVAPEVVRRGGDDEYIPVDRPFNEDVGLKSRPNSSEQPDLKGAEKGVVGNKESKK